MKKLLKSLTLATLLLSSSAAQAEDSKESSVVQAEEKIKLATYGHVDTRGLKGLIDSNTPHFLLDARGPKWNDGTILPGATLASFEFSAEELAAIVPDQKALVIVYCYDETCPLAKYVITKLVDLGYSNVLEYPGGVKEWREIAGYPVVTVE